MCNEKNGLECRSLTQLERQVVERIKVHRPKCRDIFRTVQDSNKVGKRKVVPIYMKDLSHDDAKDMFQATIHASTGARSQAAGLRLLAKACEALVTSSESFDDSVQNLNMIANTMQSLEPQDEIEGQLLSQLVVLHEQSMSWLSRAMRTDRVNFANTYLNGASKLLTRHHETLTALLKYRRGGEQRVYVEHVHVHNGGKAIVGNIGVGGGLNKKNEEGPHAKV